MYLFARRPSRILVILMALFTVLLAGGLRPGSAEAAGLLPAAGTSGYDVSYPQCGGRLPRGAAFGIVGVTDGRPFSVNPCLQTEWAWATATGDAGLYMNTANPAPTSSYYWPDSGTHDPALCVNSASTADPGCAYDYGWHAAASALGSAQAALGPGAVAVTWWLDVETGNSWNGTASANAADIQGSIDYLRSHGVAVVGVYSSAAQWKAITGGYAVGTAGSYTAAWSQEFSPLYPLADSPGWVAGATTSRQASANCRTSFTGTPTRLAQYRSAGFDADLACAAAQLTRRG